MKRTLLALLGLALALSAANAAQPSVKGRTLTEINMIPAQVLKNSISRNFYKSLLVSPLEGLVTVRGQILGARISGARIIHSDLKGLYDPLALQLTKEAVIAGHYSIERPNIPAPVCCIA